MVAACSRNGVIGRDGDIPWHLPEDLKYFKELTSGCPTIMGRKTYESIGKALPNRPAVVVSTTLESLPDAIVARSCEEALEVARMLCRQTGARRLFIIGGELLYRHFLDIAETLYLTIVDRVVDGDAQFPCVDRGYFSGPEWRRVSLESRMAVEKTLGGVNVHFYQFRRGLLQPSQALASN
jgi:dihydrofolate reductase